MAKPTPKGLVPWVPGQSGNPLGMTKEQAQVRELIREASPEAAMRLLELMRSRDEKVAMVAVKEILDRAWPKPPPPKETEGQEINSVIRAPSPLPSPVEWAETALQQMAKSSMLSGSPSQDRKPTS